MPYADGALAKARKEEDYMEQGIRGNLNWSNHYLQRLALLKDFEKKIGEENIPDSIKYEKSLLDNLVNKLLVQAQNRGNSNIRTIGEDGISIRCSKEEYEEIKLKLAEVQVENGQYITEKDEKMFNENFKWDKIPSYRVGSGAGSERIEDYVKNELDVLNISAENYMDFYQIKMDTLAALNVAKMNEAKNKEEESEHRIDGGQMPIVKESKFEQIYDNAKGKIKAMFSAIKNRFSSKHQDQVKENEEDERE